MFDMIPRRNGRLNPSQPRVVAPNKIRARSPHIGGSISVGILACRGGCDVTRRVPLSLFLWICLLTLVGCGESGRLRYSESPRYAQLGDQRVNLKAKVKTAVDELFGAAPNQILVPEGSSLVGERGTGIRAAGLYLAGLTKTETGELASIHEQSKDDPAIKGGYALYRRHCLHCHGVSGDGNGPTAPFLYPKPRDFRPGVYKFTSTNGVKPTRADLYKTIKEGLHGTSMPSFDALMTDDEIQQVIDYTLYLSIRGETEAKLIQEAQLSVADMLEPGQDVAADANLVDLFEEAGSSLVPKELPAQIAQEWFETDQNVTRPMVSRAGITAASIERGRDLYFSVGCNACHGDLGDSGGESFLDQEMYNAIVFARQPVHLAAVKRFAEERTRKTQAEETALRLVRLGSNRHRALESLRANPALRPYADEAVDHALQANAQGKLDSQSDHSPFRPKLQSAVEVAKFLVENDIALKYVFDPVGWTAAPRNFNPQQGSPILTTEQLRGLETFRAELTLAAAENRDEARAQIEAKINEARQRNQAEPSDETQAALEEALAELKRWENAPATIDRVLSWIPELRDPGFQAYFVNALTKWSYSRDEVWFNPIRPANLRKGVYKGGRRPYDLWLRIANGIQPVKMPGYLGEGEGKLNQEQIWDVVNFVLALPSNTGLLDHHQPPAPHRHSDSEMEPPAGAAIAARHE